MPPKVISGGDNPYDIHDAKLSSSATAHESSSVTAHEISNTYNQFIKGNFDYGVKEDTKARSHKNSNVIIDASDGDTEELKDE